MSTRVMQIPNQVTAMQIHFGSRLTTEYIIHGAVGIIIY